MEIKISTNDLVSIEQAAAELGIHRATIYRWIEKKEMLSVKFADKLYIPVSEVTRLKNRPEEEAVQKTAEEKT